MKGPGLLLGVDTTEDGLVLSLGDGLRPPRATRLKTRRQDERLFPALRGLLASRGLGLGDLEGVAVASGPGRFTGIRVGLSFATMLGRCLGIPVVAVSHFEAAAAEASAECGRCLLWIELRGSGEERFLQAFRISSDGGCRAMGGPRWFPGSIESRAESERRGSGLRAVFRAVEGRPGPGSLLAAARRRVLAGEAAPARALYVKPAHYERGG